jgi:carboxylesterase
MRPSFIVAIAGLCVLFVVFVWRMRYVRETIASTTRRRRIGDDGIVIGGAGFVLERPGAPAVLLLHGAGDTPQTLRYLAAALHVRGFHVSAPLLPGHGRSVGDFARVTADQLSEAAQSSYNALTRAHEWVGIIGLSMGGALAAQLAANNGDLPALGLIAPYLAMPRTIERAARLAWLWGLFVPVVRSDEGVSIVDPLERERNLAYGVFTPAALGALYRTMRRAVDALPRVTAPTLVIQSRQDNRIAPSDAERAFARLGAREKRLEWITGAGHVITVDHGHERVATMMTAWMRAHAGSGRRTKHETK